MPAACPSSLAWRAPGLALLAAVALAGCGRIGPLEPPPDATTAQTRPDMPKLNEVSGETLNPQMKPKIAPITPPNRPFFLDFLLK